MCKISLYNNYRGSMIKYIVLFILGFTSAYTLGAQVLRPGTDLDVMSLKDSIVMVGIEGRPLATGFVVESPRRIKFIATNAHVCVEKSMVARYQYDSFVKLTVERIDAKLDLCILSGNVEPKALKLSDAYKPFERITVVGHPHLLPLTVSTGVLGIDGYRESDVLSSVEVHPGNSGSPVFNKYGEVIGIVNAYDTRSNYAYIVYAKYLIQMLVGL